jgi:hypothetical protein
MLMNIPVRFHNSRPITFLATCDTKKEPTDGEMGGRTDRQTRVNLNAPPPIVEAQKEYTLLYIVIKDMNSTYSAIIVIKDINNKNIDIHI